MIKQIFKAYLQENKRVQIKVIILKHFLIQHPNPIDLIIESSKKLTNAIQLFKMIIFIHNCIMDQQLPKQPTILLLTNLLHKTSQSKNVSHNKFEIMLIEKAINPYVLYLQKKLQNSFEGLIEKEISMFQDLNLLKRGVSFSDILFTFGRYFINQYPFIIDFNILLAKDIQQLYQNLKTKIQKCKNLIDEGLKLQLQYIHQKMYIVYYNCYFYKEVKDYIPRWIDTDTTIKSTPKQKPKNKNIAVSQIVCSAKKNNQSSLSTTDYLENSKNYTNQSVLFSKNQNDDYLWKSGSVAKNQNNEHLYQSGIFEMRERIVEETVEEISEDVSEQEEENKDLKLLKSLERIVADLGC